jgi:hypothetical protein
LWRSYAIRQGYGWKLQEWPTEPPPPLLLLPPQLLLYILQFHHQPRAVAKLVPYGSSNMHVAAADTAATIKATCMARVHSAFFFTLLTLPQPLFCFCSCAITQGYGWKPQEWLSEPSLVQLLSSPELHLLLMLHAAAGTHHVINLKTAAAAQQDADPLPGDSEDNNAAQDKDRDQKQNSQKSKLKQEDISNVPRWHERVYSACGLPAGVDLTGVFALWQQNHPSIASVQVLGLALQMIAGGFWNPVSKKRGFIT